MRKNAARPDPGRAASTAPMKTHRLLFLIPVLIAVSCASPAGTGEVEAAYKSFAAAVLAEDAAALARLAPFLAKEGSGKALEALRAILRPKPSFTVRMADEANAEVVLSDPGKTAVPFRKNAAGEWVVSEEITRTRHIDFIPAR